MKAVKVGCPQKQLKLVCVSSPTRFGFDGFELIDGRTSYSDIKDSKDDSKEESCGE